MNSSKPRLLFFSCISPLPSDRGDRLRALQMLDILRRHASVRLVCLERRWEAPVQDWSACQGIDVRTIPVGKQEVIFEGVRALLKGEPYIALRFGLRRVKDFFKKEIDTYHPDIVWFQGINSYPFLELSKDVKRVLDLTDSPSLYILMNKFSKDTRFLDRLQGILQWNIKEIEKISLSLSNKVIVCSKSNLEYLIYTYLDPGNISIIPNCVSSKLLERSWSPSTCDQKRVLFVGNLTYPPNVHGIRTFIQNVWPHVLDTQPEAELLVVGRAPERVHKELASYTGIRVLGFVEDLLSLYQSAHVAIVPTEVVSGVQTKLLEAMAIGIPTVVSPASARANNVTHGKQVLVSDISSSFAEAIITLFHDESLARELSYNSRKFIQDHHTWEAQENRVVEILRELTSITT